MAVPSRAVAQEGEPEMVALKRPSDWAGLASLAFGPKNKLLAGGTSSLRLNGRQCGCRIVVWSTKGGKPKKEMTGHTSSVTALAFTADGKQIVSHSAESGEVRVFDARRGKQKRMFQTPTLDPQYSYVAPLLSSTGTSLAHFAQGEMEIAGKKKRRTGELTVWDVATGEVRWRRAQTQAETAALSPDGSLVAYYAQELNYRIVDGKAHYSAPNSVVHVLSMADGKVVRSLDVGFMPVGGLAFTVDNKTLIAVNEQLRLFSLSDGKVTSEVADAGVGAGVRWAHMRGDQGGFALAGRFSNDIHLWGLEAGKPVARSVALVDGVQHPMRFNEDFGLLACEISGKPALLRYSNKKKGRRRR